MTRDEYIKWLKQLDENLKFDGLIDGDKEVDLHEMIFDLCEMLEQQTCEDAVSRKDVLNLVDNLNDGSFRWASIRTKIARLHLVQPELEPCEDAVSRAAVLDIFADNADATRPYSTAWEEVKALPSVNPQPKTGHWIEHDHGFDTKYYQCPICKGYDGSPKGKYCKWCGARMIQLQESEVSNDNTRCIN